MGRGRGGERKRMRWMKRWEEAEVGRGTGGKRKGWEEEQVGRGRGGEREREIEKILKE